MYFLQISPNKNITLDLAVCPLFERRIHFADERSVKVFDLLYLNGQPLLHHGVAFRKKNLRQCLKEIKGRIEFGMEWKGRTAKDIREKMDEIMESRGEGLVIKHPKSQYVLNGRNMDWIKVCYLNNLPPKPFYTNFFR